MARPRSVPDTDLVGALSTVFRRSGYDGASLAALSSEAGLRSASLYHRFPAGKSAMALAVLADVERQFAEVLAPLGGTGEVRADVAETAHRLAGAYDDGRLACVLDTMTLHGAPQDVRQGAARLATSFIDAMAGAARRAGLPDDEAAHRAREAFVRVEGSLVLARVLGDPDAFTTTLSGLPDLLTERTTP